MKEDNKRKNGSKRERKRRAESKRKREKIEKPLQNIYFFDEMLSNVGVSISLCQAYHIKFLHLHWRVVVYFERRIGQHLKVKKA